MVKVEISDYSVDRRVRVIDPGAGDLTPVGGRRDVIKGFSPASRRRLDHVARNYSQSCDVMLTLTYPGDVLFVPDDGRIVKRDLDEFIRALIHVIGKDSRYIWILEFQRRGAPHLHVWVDSPCLRRKLEKDPLIVHRWVSSKWTDIVFARFINYAEPWLFKIHPVFADAFCSHLRAGTRVEKMRLAHGCAAYVSKEGAKLLQKKVPPQFASVGRFWGVSRNFRNRQPVVTVHQVDEATLPLVVLEVGAARRRAWIERGIDVQQAHPLSRRGARILGGAGAEDPVDVAIAQFQE